MVDCGTRKPNYFSKLLMDSEVHYAEMFLQEFLNSNIDDISINESFLNVEI
jgi:hypothetical protein